ncbi:MAG TPA: succinylglutamate desuccinylase/aspartoacylase family protein [Usitatibacter sp.]|nr:succinylglutamate desuccinylase/aspartoacylase family protein [Usitatibacter sp.]
MTAKKHHFKSVTYAGLAPGPKLIVTGAVHGNETCGTRGIQRVMAEIDSGGVEIAAGTVTFVPITNPLAYAKGERAGDRNLNRNLSPNANPVDFEDHVANWLCPLLSRHEVLLDLHSTRARTQPFALFGPDNNSGKVEPFQQSEKERALVRRLGVSRFVQGWLATYAKGVERRIAEARHKGVTGDRLTADPKYGVGTTEYMRSQGGYSITLECGQHDDPSSPEVAYRAIRNTLDFLGITEGEPPAPVEKYEALRIHDVIDRAHEGDRFAKEWSSFDPLAKGELIGTRHDGTEVRAPGDGWILFPDKGSKPGNEWFYLAQPLEKI